MYNYRQVQSQLLSAMKTRRINIYKFFMLKDL